MPEAEAPLPVTEAVAGLVAVPVLVPEAVALPVRVRLAVAVWDAVTLAVAVALAVQPAAYSRNQTRAVSGGSVIAMIPLVTLT